MPLLPSNRPHWRAPAALALFCAVLAAPAQAALINFDLTSSTGDDAYTVGSGLLGTATSLWNTRSRTLSATDLVLTNDTGAATSVTLSYTRQSSGAFGPLTGGFSNLGTSVLRTDTTLFKGLTAGQTYQLAIFSSGDGVPSFEVNGVVNATTQTGDWSQLTSGTHYALFQVAASANGTIAFTSPANPTSAFDATVWSAFQLQDVPATAVSEPGALASTALALAALALVRRRRQPPKAA